MSELPVLRSGACAVFEERWHGRLWTAVPQRVVDSSPTAMACWVPAGTRSMYATNRGLPETVGLTREERKLRALETGTAVAAEFVETPAKLCIYRPDRWARVNLGWATGGDFLGWYVDFQLPVVATPYGLVSKDLVLDLWVNPDRSWHWKDQDDFEQAVKNGIVAADLRSTLRAEAEHVLAELAEHTGPFSGDCPRFVPDTHWDCPVLPTTYRWGGAAWALPFGHRADSPAV